LKSSLPEELERYRAVSESVAAPLLGVAKMTLANWRCQRKGPPYIVVNGRSIRYNLGDLLSWRDRGRIDPEAPPV
jgi:hypothetical protein